MVNTQRPLKISKDSMMKKFAVLSNPRSGTSLLVNLMLSGFDPALFLPIEETPTTGRDIYDYRVLISTATRYLYCEECCFLFILRDPRDVVVSLHPSAKHECDFLVDFRVWLNNYKEFLSIYALIPEQFLVLRYEDLIKNPNEVQRHISEFMNIKEIRFFSECFSFFDRIDKDRSDDMRLEMGGARPMDEKRIGRWKDPMFEGRIRDQFEKTPEMVDVLKSLGYYNGC